MRRSVALCYNPELMILQLRNARSGAHVAIATSRSSTALFPLCSSRSLARSLGLAVTGSATYLQHGVCCAGARSGREQKCFCLPGCLNGSGGRESPDRGSTGQGKFLIIPQSNGSKKVIRYKVPKPDDVKSESCFSLAHLHGSNS